MAIESINYVTGLTRGEEEAVIQWLEVTAASASSSAEQANQAANALRIIKGLNNTIKALAARATT